MLRWIIARSSPVSPVFQRPVTQSMMQEKERRDSVTARWRHRSRYRQLRGPVAKREEKNTIKSRIASTQAPGLAVDDAGKRKTRIPQRLMTASKSLPTAVRPCSRTRKKQHEPRIAGAPGPGLAVDDVGEQMTRFHHSLVTASESLPTRVRPL